MRVAPDGGVLVSKAPLGPLVSLEVQFALFTVQLLLLADTLPHPALIQAHRADTVSRWTFGAAAYSTAQRSH